MNNYNDLKFKRPANFDFGNVILADF